LADDSKTLWYVSLFATSLFPIAPSDTAFLFFFKEVHPFIYEALLSLVQVHAQVRAVAKRLVVRSITALLEELAQVTLDAFNKIQSFGMGGMLQASYWRAIRISHVSF